MMLNPSEHGTKLLSPEILIAVHREKPYNAIQPAKLARPDYGPMNRTLFLKHIPLFADLSETKKQLLAKELSRVQFKKGDAIFFEGDPGQTLYIVESGHVRIYLHCEDGQETSVNVCTSSDIIAQDASLSHGLLALVNSPAFSLSRTINSLEQAVAFLGLNQLRAWLTVLTMAAIPDKPLELTNLAMLRAKMCQLLAPMWRSANRMRSLSWGCYRC